MGENTPYLSALNVIYVSCLQFVRTQNGEIFSPGQTLFTKYHYHSTSQQDEKSWFLLIRCLTGCMFCWDLETVLELIQEEQLNMLPKYTQHKLWLPCDHSENQNHFILTSTVL